MSCLSEYQKFWLRLFIKENNPELENEVIENLIKFIDGNAKKLCDKNNIESPPSREIVDEAYMVKMTKFANCIRMKI